MRTIQLHVEGMRCRRCVRQATALLRDVPGVATVMADSRTSRITVTGELSDEAVRRALANTAFTVRVQDPSPPRLPQLPPTRNRTGQA